MSDHQLFGLGPDPFANFEKWYQAALSVEENAGAFAFATVDGQGRADLRYLLYKGIKEGGLSFFTHTNSTKGEQLEVNCAAAMAFYWHQSAKQVRVRGRVGLLPLEVSRTYFTGRDRDSKLSSAASHQSSPIESRQAFEVKMENLARECGDEITAPDHWRAYTLIPDEWEFFLYGAHRINDRFRYRLEAGKWQIERLQP